MLIQLIFLFFLLFFVFFLALKISTYIYSAVFLLTKNKNIAVGVLVFFLLPGTIIHEFSHLIIATLLRVPTGELTILPTIEKNGEVRAGRLMLGKSDPFRHSLIGLAPMIIGLTLIYLVGKLFIPNLNLLTTHNSQLTTIFGFYLLFITSITMFSSKKDLESLIISIPITILAIFSLYIIGVRVFLERDLVEKASSLLADLNYFLLLTAAVDYLIFFFLSLIIYLLQKILKRRIAA
ncbi:hypothetical protein HY945_03285 [Candidatus Gottesmanbacteria bacterium]|nr:hypothetical protein [Candidatus Gottesmanbacteria bacterium]